jgi:hypothetical protein
MKPRRPGQQAAEGEPQLTDDQLRQERMEENRRLNDNRNQAAVDRRNAIADEADDLRDTEMADIEGDKIVARTAKSAEELQEDADAKEERDAAAERRRLEAGGEDPGDEDEGDEEEEATEGDSKLINGVRHYLVIVHGKEKWLTLREIREKAGKVEAADEYLQQAAESARRAVALQTSEAEESEEADTELEETLNKALLGDQESVKKLARQIKASPSRVTPDVMQAVDERLTFRDAVNWFEGEYKTELADSRLKQMIVQEDVRLRDENPTMPYRERLKKAGDSIRKWRNDVLGVKQQAGPDGNPKPSKLERKRQMSQVPAAGGRQGGNEEADVEESVSQQIERMAAGRHQARAIKH